MSADLDLTPMVRSWLHDQDRPLSGDVRERVLDQLPATPQRRAPWPAWRLNTMITPIRITAAAATIGVLAVVGGVLPRGAGPGGPNAPASPSPGASLPVAAPFPGPGALAAGTYSDPLGPGKWTVTVPERWEWFYSILFKDLDGRSDLESLGGPGEVASGWESVGNVFADPCHWKDSLADPPVGRSVDDLATAFAEQVGRDGSVTDVVFAGHPAKKVELSVPADLDMAACDEAVYREFLGTGEALALPAGHEPMPDVSGHLTVYYIVDVDGTPFTMRTWHVPETSEADLAELDAILGSVRIDMPAQVPSASASPGPLAWSRASLEQDWPAPVRAEPAGDALVVPLNSQLGGHVDPAGDTGSDALPWSDIVQVSSVSSDHMYVQLAKPIPTPVADPSERWMAYGLVLDIDDDGVPDIRLGIDNLPAAEGVHRAWRTDLHSGRTESAAGGLGKVGDSYFDTFYPGQTLPRGAPVGSARFGLYEGTAFRFYAWASVIEDGRVVTVDYAPDSGWLVAAPSN